MQNSNYTFEVYNQNIFLNIKTHFKLHNLKLYCRLHNL